MMHQRDTRSIRKAALPQHNKHVRRPKWSLLQLSAHRAGKTPARFLSLVIVIIVCAFALLPFLALALETQWYGLSLAYGDGRSVTVSLGLGAFSMVLIAAFGTPVAHWLARSQHFAKSIVELIVLAVLITPPLAMGILLISVYGPYGTLGSSLALLGISLNNNAAAFILSQVYGGIAYYIVGATAAFASVARDAEEVALTLGASRFKCFCKITLPLAARGLAAALILAWVRVLGEFGIVTIFAYFPQGIPVKIFVNLQNEGVDKVYGLLWLMLLVAIPLPMAGLYWFKSRPGRA